MKTPRLRVLLAVACLANCAALAAQVPVPALPQLQVPAPADAVGALAGEARGVVRSARELRDLRLRVLQRRFPRQVERDPRGAPALRSVIVALSPSAQALEAALAAGFSVQRDETLPGLGERVVTLLAPRGLSTRRALDQLRRRDPSGQYDFSHLYAESAAESGGDTPVTSAVAPGRDAMASAVSKARIGLIDSGVRRDHPALRASTIETFGCDGRVIPAPHGTAVASLLVGEDGRFRGAAPRATLFAADVWCGNDAPGGRVEDIARSLAWLAESEVRVINLSLVGPPNVVLEALVKRVQMRGIVLVAAAGNDGPNAPPLYPAAYPGVIAVTAVDARHRALLEAARGRHIRFAAPGADMLAAALTPDYLPVRGTSFAAPLVAGLIATQIAAGADGATALRVLTHQARDLGRKGRDDVYGDGVLGEDIAPPLAAAVK